MNGAATGLGRKPPALPGEPGTGRDRWAWLGGAAQEIHCRGCRPLTLRRLGGVRDPQHVGGIGPLSAAVRGQGHRFHDPAEAEALTGSTRPAAVCALLMDEREEFLPAPWRAGTTPCARAPLTRRRIPAGSGRV